MSAPIVELEGTWEEIVKRAPDFDNKRLRVTVRIAEEPRKGAPDRLDDALAEIWRTVPDSSWDSLPSDFAENMDRYLYGQGKSE